MGILFEKKHDILMENCSNIIYSFIYLFIYLFWFYGKLVVNEAVFRINSS